MKSLKLNRNLISGVAKAFLLLCISVLTITSVSAADTLPKDVIFKSGEKGDLSLAGSVSMTQRGIQFTCFSNLNFRHKFQDKSLEKLWTQRLATGRVIPVVLKGNFYKGSGSRGGGVVSGGLFLHAGISECEEVSPETIISAARAQGLSKESCDLFLDKVTPDATVGGVEVSLDRVFKGAALRGGGNNVMSRSLRIANPTDSHAQIKVVGMKLVHKGRTETLKISPNKDQSAWEVSANTYYDDFISFVSSSSYKKGAEVEAKLSLLVNEQPVEITRAFVW